ncbi:hypothetical protein ElyMa_004414900 [Elysia marginata]|uniref:Peptidase S1 domain-containing protein n=1 Tax=Elysia marginata TaxID=1093978 RepID=A0AAV4HDK0_9GAST|nr:hypothetical protein ElyMa_004414900 [Elysia marginata]
MSPGVLGNLGVSLYEPGSSGQPWGVSVLRTKDDETLPSLTTRGRLTVKHPVHVPSPVTDADKELSVNGWGSQHAPGSTVATSPVTWAVVLSLSLMTSSVYDVLAINPTSLGDP